jgi:hypothetical protein
VWEQKPQVFKATAARKALFQNLMTFKQLQKYALAMEEEGKDWIIQKARGQV